MASQFPQSGADLNPYAPSAVVQPTVPVPPQQLGGLNGLWRKGNLIVVQPQAMMPQICIRTGQKGDKPVKLKLAWCPPWIYIFGLLVVVYFQKRRELTPWLSQKEFTRHQRIQSAGYLTFFGSFYLAGTGFLLATDAIGNQAYVLAGIVFAIAIISMLTGVVLMGPMSTILSPKKITDQYALVAGAKEPFLQLLEEFPHPLP